MVTVSILVLKNSVPASIADARYVFQMVNEFLRQAGRPRAFEVQLIGATREVTLADGLFTVKADSLMTHAEDSALIIVPALAGDMKSAVYLNRGFAGWIADRYKNGTEVASLCTGAFLLAYAGSLRGRSCTTHWAYANEFKLFYPSVKLVDEKVITDQQGLYSSGGSNAYWNLLIHLVEKYTDREMAIRTAKYFVIDMDRHVQSPFIIFNGLKDHGDELILKAQAAVEGDFRKRITVDQLADTFHITRRTFERRFKKATRYTVAEYVQRVKVEAARRLLEIGRKSATEVMQDVGYSDIHAFRNLFRRITGMTLVEYRNKYKKGA